MEIGTDRIKVALGLTLSLGHGTYEFIRPEISYESDVKLGETPEEALNRIREFVELSLEQFISQFRKEV